MDNLEDKGIFKERVNNSGSFQKRIEKHSFNLTTKMYMVILAKIISVTEWTQEPEYRRLKNIEGYGKQS